MRRTVLLALAIAGAAVAVPAIYHYLTQPSDGPLNDTLRRYGFVPINPPSNLMSVGSLYYVDAAVRDFKAICHPAKADLEGLVIASRSWEMEESLQRNGRFTTGVNVDVGALLTGDLDTTYVQKVHSSLTDVTLEEIPLGSSWLVFAKLMERPECNKVAMQYIHAGGYVCQGQKILQATAEFKLDRDTQSKIATKAKVTPDEIKGAVKRAVETQSDQSVVDKGGRLFAGVALKYGVSMNPTCLAPPDGRFERVLPRTVIGRVVNFLLFSVIEPVWPGKVEHQAVADAR